MPEKPLPQVLPHQRSKYFYGWIVVAACALMLGVTYGSMYSYSVFFKPLAETFNWDRATVSLVFSASFVFRGAVSIVTGYLADRLGALKIMVVCGFLIGLGLVLSSLVQELWHFFLSYAVIEAIGLSGTFGIGTTMVARWFTKNRGLALGIVATGSGLGILFIAPATERLIDSFGWQQAFLICGLVAGVLMIGAALLLRQPPSEETLYEAGNILTGKKGRISTPLPDATVRKALRDRRMLLLMAAFFTFFFGIQIVMVHLVNHATDVGFSPLVAATFVSAIGAISIISRLSMGVVADRIGIHNSLIITRVFMMIAYIFLIFTRPLWSFYVFAVLFAIPWGGEIPQIPLYIGKYFGTKSMSTLMGINLFIIALGGAIGPWIAGLIFDTTDSYRLAFIAGALAAFASLLMVVLLKKWDEHTG